MVHGTASSITSKFADNIHKFSVFEVPEPGFWKAIIRLPDGVFQVSKFPFPQYGDEEEVDRAVWDKTGLYPVEILWPLEMIDGEERWLTGKLSTIKNMWRTYADWEDEYTKDEDWLAENEGKPIYDWLNDEALNVIRKIQALDIAAERHTRIDSMNNPLGLNVEGNFPVRSGIKKFASEFWVLRNELTEKTRDFQRWINSVGGISSTPIMMYNNFLKGRESELFRINFNLRGVDKEIEMLDKNLPKLKSDTKRRFYSESGEIARWLDNFIDDVDRLTQEVQQGHSEFRSQLNAGLGAGIIGRIEPKLDTFYKKGRELSDTFTHGLDDLDMAVSYLNSNDQSNIHSSFDKLLEELDDMRRTLGILQAQKGSIFYNEADKIKMFAEELYNFSDIIIQPNKKEIQHDNIATWNRWTFDILDKDTPRNDYVPGQIVLDTYKGYPVAEAISFTKPSHMKDKSSVGFFRSSLSQLKKWLPSIKEIEGSRTSGAKTINPFQSRRPAQNKRVSNRANFKYEEMSDDIVTKAIDGLMDEMRDVDKLRHGMVARAIYEMDKMGSREMARKIQSFVKDAYSNVKPQYERLMGMNLPAPQRGFPGLDTVEALLQRWEIDMNTNYLPYYIENERLKLNPDE